MVIVLAQGLLLVVCAVCFALMSTWQDEAQSVATTVVSPADSTETDRQGERVHMGEALQHEEIEVNAPPVDVEDSTTAVAPKKEELYRAEQRLSLEERVAQLLGNTSLYHDGEINYKELLSQKTTWRVPLVLVRFDELAAIYMAALREAAPKVKDGKLLSAKAEVQGDKVIMTLQIGFNVTNNLLKLFMGGGEQQVTVCLTAEQRGESVAVTSVEASGNKKYSDSAVKIGSDFLFGTEDYLTFVSDIAQRTTSSLGAISAVDEVRYGVIFRTATES